MTTTTAHSEQLAESPFSVSMAVGRVGVPLVLQIAAVNIVVETMTLCILPFLEHMRIAFLESLFEAIISTTLLSAVIYRFMIRPIRTQLAETTSALNTAREKSELLAQTDPLTQLANRRSFFDYAEKQWSQACRADADLSCIMLDIDHFKKFNDVHGHAVGDEVLKGVARALSGACRPGDLVGRYGGEEFCVVLPSTSLAEALRVAERMRLSVCDHPVKLSGKSFDVQISLGVAEKRAGIHDFEHLVSRADTGLLAAKKQGRNRTVTVQEQDDDVDLECRDAFTISVV